MDESADPGIAQPGAFDPRRPLARELEPSVRDGFSLCAVGDCIISRPLTPHLQEPGFRAVTELLRDCDVLYGNLETPVLDLRAFAGAPHAYGGDWALSALPAVAEDLAALGFGLLARANNHALDWGVEGMRETGHRLDAAGLTHAGTGENLGLARAARYRETGMGRIGLVSCVSTFRETSDALDQSGSGAPGRPGVAPLRVTATARLPAPLLEQAHAFGAALEGAGLGELLAAHRFAAGAEPGYTYAADPGDLAGVLRAVRQGKQNGDLLLLALHSHEPADDRYPQLPADFVGAVARAAVDAGADAVLVTGLHHLGPVELYPGRPILHGLGDFIWSDIQEPLPADLRHENDAAVRRAFRHPERATDADLNLLVAHPYHSSEETFHGVVARCVFAAGRAAEVRLHPVDLGYGKPLTRSGVPHVADPETAGRILDRLEAISAPYGTRIERVADNGTVIGVVA